MLQFKGSQATNYYDSFSLVTENYTKVIQVCAQAPCPNIAYNTDINLNNVPVNETTSLDIEFTHTGCKGQVVLNSQNKNLSPMPQFLEIEKNQSKTVNIKVKPKDEGS